MAGDQAMAKKKEKNILIKILLIKKYFISYGLRQGHGKKKKKYFNKKYY